MLPNYISTLAKGLRSTIFFQLTFVWMKVTFSDKYYWWFKCFDCELMSSVKIKTLKGLCTFILNILYVVILTKYLIIIICFVPHVPIYRWFEWINWIGLNIETHQYLLISVWCFFILKNLLYLVWPKKDLSLILGCLIDQSKFFLNVKENKVHPQNDTLLNELYQP